ncbi:hypothetical protein LGIHADK_02886 [Mannheimia haemolytica]
MYPQPYRNVHSQSVFRNPNILLNSNRYALVDGNSCTLFRKPLSIAIGTVAFAIISAPNARNFATSGARFFLWFYYINFHSLFKCSLRFKRSQRRLIAVIDSFWGLVRFRVLFGPAGASAINSCQKSGYFSNIKVFCVPPHK